MTQIAVTRHHIGVIEIKTRSQAPPRQAHEPVGMRGKHPRARHGRESLLTLKYAGALMA